MLFVMMLVLNFLNFFGSRLHHTKFKMESQLDTIQHYLNIFHSKRTGLFNCVSFVSSGNTN